MKKIAFLSLVVLMPGVSGAASTVPPWKTPEYSYAPNPMFAAPAQNLPGTCGETYISFDGTQDVDHNEFLFVTEKGFERADAADQANQDGADLAGELVYECDNRHCPSGTEITLEANHIFQRIIVPEKKRYKCVTGIQDKWVEVSMPLACQFRGLNLSVNQWYNDLSNPMDTDATTVDANSCMGLMGYDANATGFYAKCEEQDGAAVMTCHAAACQAGYTLSDGKCVAGGNATVAGKVGDKSGKTSGGNDGFAPISEENDTDLRARLTQTITTSVAGLDGIKADFDVSRWKNAEGKFNTSRLVSDSVAGVVLGTAGGLITSSVVKKNQVKKGFEDISCTVGGQVVAGWDDQFRVGIR